VLRAAGLFVAVWTLAAPAVANAQEIDLSKMTCKQFVESGKQTMGSIMIWLDGYFASEDDPAVIDFPELNASTEKLRSYCVDNPTTPLMTAAEEIFTGQR
jgi:acid stress chaperone HdeB